MYFQEPIYVNSDDIDDMEDSEELQRRLEEAEARAKKVLLFTYH
jgi:hypothetical protein